MPGDIPPTMLASVLKEVGVVDVEERPVPQPGPNEVLVRVASVGVCGSDVHYYEHGRIAHFVVEEPLILGHEASGTIVTVGSHVPDSRVGERVAIEPQKPCRACEHCKSGAYNLCPHMEFYATPPIDGAFCEYVLIEEDFAHPVPDEVSDDAAALIEPLSVGIAAAQKGGVSYGATVLIAGSGPIGVIAAQVCRAYGAAEVVVELGSGTSTIWVGYALAATGSGRLMRQQYHGAPIHRRAKGTVIHQCSGVRTRAAARTPEPVTGETHIICR
jgi:L-iditol 2-dehydrogenase